MERTRCGPPEVLKLHCTNAEYYAVVPVACSEYRGRVPAFKARIAQFAPWKYELGLWPLRGRKACMLYDSEIAMLED